MPFHQESTKVAARVTLAAQLYGIAEGTRSFPMIEQLAIHERAALEALAPLLDHTKAETIQCSCNSIATEAKFDLILKTGLNRLWQWRAFPSADGEGGTWL